MVGLLRSYGMEYKRDVAFCQFRDDFNILYVFSVSSECGLLARFYTLGQSDISEVYKLNV
jgi:hypothetical protein